ncbi:TlpA disulfide reductase family protein [Chitinophaga sp. YIM B06452]|uniref:TlpA family protein disulfide reductase n=1 Tax=Chitinophaga sp. YIM B06452 TaxID=3082158 RepID=UPI0031FF3631
MLLKTVRLVLFSIVCIQVSAAAQDRPTLSIGDKAPELRYGKWLKGSPIKEYEKGRLYLFEFWATWCGPCIASMPHLSEFARERKHEATVIAVNIWEEKGDKPYENTWPKVTRFVQQMGNKMDFNVITDSKDQFMGNSWMKAAGQEGIPCTIMVKDGTILWMGHPVELDSVVNVVLSGKYDVEASKKAREEKQRISDSVSAPFRKVMGRYDALVKEKQYQEAVNVMDSAIAGSSPEYAGTFGFLKFQAMLEHISEDAAMEYVKKWQSTKPGYTGSVAGIICSKPGYKKSTYEYGIQLMEGLLANPQMPPPAAYKFIAMGYANMGDYKQAIGTLEKSIKTGKELLKEGKFAGFVTEDSIKEQETQLAEYKKALKK